MTDDLTIIIYVKDGPNGDYVDIKVDKPKGMTMAEVIGRLEEAKHDLLNGGTVQEH